MEFELLTVAEAAKVLGIGRTKAYELVAGGCDSDAPNRASRRVPRQALGAWIEAQTDGPGSAHFSKTAGRRHTVR